MAFQPVLTEPGSADRPARVVEWSEFAARAKTASRVVAEFGIGDGDWLTRHALAEPDALYVGFEAVLAYYQKASARIVAAGSPALLAFGDARLGVLPAFIPAGSLDLAVYLFPDPWTKGRHMRRRMLAPQNAAYVARAIKVGGVLRVRSDVPDYLREALENFPPLGFECVFDETNLDVERAVTRWERRKLQEGQTIREVQLRRVRGFEAGEDPGEASPIDVREVAVHRTGMLRAAGIG